jgi:hypothetical protein
MKADIRNFGKRKHTSLFIIFVCITVQLFSCVQKESGVKTLNAEELINTSKNNDFINERYLQDIPLASLVNMSTYEQREVFFQLNKEENIQIYGVGEAGVGYMDVNPDHLFKSDVIDFYFDFPNRSSDVIMNQEGHFAYSFSWLDGLVKSNHISFSKQGSEYYGYYDTLTKGYVAEIKFPWKVFNINQMNTDTTIGFDIVVSDNDDGKKQNGKLAWHSRSDNLNTSASGYGKLTLMRKLSPSVSRDTLFSSFEHPRIDGRVESLWNIFPTYQLNNLIAGNEKDPEDLSVNFKSCWDQQNLYFLINIHDPGKKHVKSKSIREFQTLSDFGWIEDTAGNKIWEMHIRDAQYAGGAQKNIKTDQIIHLKTGKYKLKYFSDESHAWDNWDDHAPKTPFYGIVLYKCR